MKSAVQALMALADRCGPVVSLAEIRAVGLSARQLRSCYSANVIRHLGGPAYAIGGGSLTEMDLLVAATLRAAPNDGIAAASHRSAGLYWAMRGIAAVRPEVLVVGVGRNRCEDVIVHRTDALAPQDVVKTKRFLVTSPPRTLCDLGAVVPPGVVERAFEDAFFRDLVNLRRVREVNDRLGGKGRRGTGVLRTILDVRDPDLAPPHSELELQVSRLLRRAGIRPEATQHVVTTPEGKQVVVDFLLGGKKVIEADSVRWHAGREDVLRNLRKLRALVLLGYTVMPVGWVDVKHAPQETIRDIRKFLGLSP